MCNRYGYDCISPGFFLNSKEIWVVIGGSYQHSLLFLTSPVQAYAKEQPHFCFSLAVISEILRSRNSENVDNSFLTAETIFLCVPVAQ